ncbi:hypothetical protein D5274_02880 [bacterium 1XD42-94]|nr:hypothetical protein [bacterium 1XD42-76]NBK04132.1 hypothetical protein [bacterium 1XD42-94]
MSARNSAVRKKLHVCRKRLCGKKLTYLPGEAIRKTFPCLPGEVMQENASAPVWRGYTGKNFRVCWERHCEKSLRFSKNQLTNWR